MPIFSFISQILMFGITAKALACARFSRLSAHHHGQHGVAVPVRAHPVFFFR